MSNRDDFKGPTKRALALRAGYICSFENCGKFTAGPSEESSEAVTMIGEAAHISGASCGKGSRRYLASMTSEERSSIDNAIWLCSDHARQIDRDEVRYTVEALQAMKFAHEALQSIAVRTGANRKLGKGLLAVGPDVICMGDIENVSAESWTLSLKHFVLGSAHELIAFINGFAASTAQDRYILSKELGDGRRLSQAPSLTKQGDGYLLLCPVQERFPRINVQDLGSRFAAHPETNDMFLDAKGNIARVGGLDALRQGIRSVLSMQRGENVFNPDAGMRLFEYFENFKGSPWLGWLMTLDVIRQASIPYTNKFIPSLSTPLQCVSRVRSFELLSETPVDGRVPVRVDFEIQGLGPWQQEFSIYMPTKAQMDERATMLAQRSFS